MSCFNSSQARPSHPPTPARSWWLVLGGSRPHTVFVSCLLLAALWDFTAFFCASPE